MSTQNAQLSLIEGPHAWRLDKHTREVGREGVARARAALRAGRHAHPPDPPASPARPARSRRPVKGGHPVKGGPPTPGAGRAAAA